jgi:hypothetical protein
VDNEEGVLFYKISDPYAGPVFRKTEAGCIPSGTGEQGTFYELGEPVRGPLADVRLDYPW